MLNEKELVKKCLRGNTKAEGILYKRYSPKMLGVCIRFAKNVMEAEDILQEGFIKVLTNLKQFKFQGSLEGWIRKIIVNTALNHYKKNLKFSKEIELDIIEESISTNENFYEQMSVQEIIKLIQSMPNGYRMVFNLYAIEGYSHREIGDLLNISENTSKSQLSRARRILQEKIKNINKEKLVSLYEK